MNYIVSNRLKRDVSNAKLPEALVNLGVIVQSRAIDRNYLALRGGYAVIQDDPALRPGTSTE